MTNDQAMEMTNDQAPMTKGGLVFGHWSLVIGA
jgi:hypothetical protein